MFRKLKQTMIWDSDFETGWRARIEETLKAGVARLNSSNAAKV